MPIPLTPIILAGATAAIGHFFQNTAKKNARSLKAADAELERQRQLRDVELKNANKIFLDTNEYIGEIQTQLMTLEMVLNDPEQFLGFDKHLQYEKAVQAQLKVRPHLPRIQGMVKIYFGDESVDILKTLNNNFDFLFFKYHTQLKSEDKAEQKESLQSETDEIDETLNEFLKEISAANNSGIIEELVKLMLTQIQNQTVGRLHPSNKT